MSLTIHPELETRLRERALAEGLTVEAYLERLIQDEEAEIVHTEALLDEAVASGDYIELTEEEWDRIEKEAFAEVDRRAKSRHEETWAPRKVRRPVHHAMRMWLAATRCGRRA